MIEEDYVSYETAKLLKEKEFDWPCFCTYEINDVKDVLLTVVLSAPLSNSDLDNTIEPHKCYSAPTFQVAMKWLEEMHSLIITIYSINIAEPLDKEEPHRFTNFYFNIATTTKSFQKDIKGYHRTAYATYEEACEEAIRYCLEKMI